jgi:hypothetical protein
MKKKEGRYIGEKQKCNGYVEYSVGTMMDEEEKKERKKYSDYLFFFFFQTLNYTLLIVGR